MTEKESLYFVVRVKGKKIFAVNIRSGTRRVNIGNGNDLVFSDILPTKPQAYKLYDDKGNFIRRNTILKAIEVHSLEMLEYQHSLQTGVQNKIGEIEFTDGAGTLHRFKIPR